MQTGILTDAAECLIPYSHAGIRGPIFPNSLIASSEQFEFVSQLKKAIGA